MNSRLTNYSSLLRCWNQRRSWNRTNYLRHRYCWSPRMNSRLTNYSSLHCCWNQRKNWSLTSCSSLHRYWNRTTSLTNCLIRHYCWSPKTNSRLTSYSSLRCCCWNQRKSWNRANCLIRHYCWSPRMNSIPRNLSYQKVGERSPKLRDHGSQLSTSGTLNERSDRSQLPREALGRMASSSRKSPTSCPSTLRHPCPRIRG